MEFRGIDVSVFQGNINWDSVEDTGIQFAMVRASYGVSGIDKMFSYNMDKVKGTNISVGAYHYCYALNKEQAISEANHFINTIKPHMLHYPAALDIEEMSIANLGKDTVTDIIVAFIDVIKKANYYPILYTNPNWLENYIDTSRISDLDIWLADWDDEPSYTGNLSMWQYTSNGTVNGINDAVDMNISYKDFKDIITQGGFNGIDQSQNPESPSQPRPVVYVVRKGDSLWSISQQFLGSGNKYREIMALNGLSNDKIFPGQILRIPQDGTVSIFYIVKRGDTLWEIAQRFLGNANRYKEIMNLNGMINDIIYPGQIIKIPSEPSSIVITYYVQDGDTLWDIANKFLGNGERYKEIMEFNSLTNDLISVGQPLKIPQK